ncbi:hypothetical protein JCM8547_003527 [Rhodosporidiobolus lusitaniae]
MQIRRFLPVLPLLFRGVAAQNSIISIPQLDIGLLQNGALVNIGLFASVLGENSCPAANVAGVISILGLVNICACVNLLNPGTGESACPPCPANASPICGGGSCACQCNAGFFATAAGTCVATTDCPAPNTLVQDATGTTFTCQCAAGYISNGAGGCVLTPSARARAARHRRAFPPKHGQAVFAPQTSESRPAYTCPDGETACPLPSGGFECIDTTTSLNSCGGCVGAGESGQNCLAIPGALAVQCHESACHVGSCFKGWKHLKDGNGRCV